MGCVTLGKLLNLCTLRFLNCEVGNNGASQAVLTKNRAERLAHGKRFVHLSHLLVLP